MKWKDILKSAKENSAYTETRDRIEDLHKTMQEAYKKKLYESQPPFPNYGEYAPTCKPYEAIHPSDNKYGLSIGDTLIKQFNKTIPLPKVFEHKRFGIKLNISSMTIVGLEVGDDPDNVDKSVTIQYIMNDREYRAEVIVPRGEKLDFGDIMEKLSMEIGRAILAEMMAQKILKKENGSVDGSSQEYASTSFINCKICPWKE